MEKIKESRPDLYEYRVQVYHCIGCRFSERIIVGPNLEEAINSFYKNHSGIEIMAVING
jgi:hypothetical protein